MNALPANFLGILKNKLEKEFVPHLPELLQKDRPKDDQDKKQLSRAFSGFVIHKMLNVGIGDAAQAVVDDFDDNGLDAIYYDSMSRTLYLVQTKYREREQFKEDDAIRFRNGVDLLLGQKYQRFNDNVRRREGELNNAFDEADRIQLVVAYIGTGFSTHAKAVLKELTEDQDYDEFGRLQADIEEYGPERIQADLLAEQSVGTVDDVLTLSKWQHLGGHLDTHIGIAMVSDLVALHQKHNKALYERNIRYFLGSRDSGVNRSIQETLRMAPEQFFYLNNGITALADQIDIPRGSKASRRLRLRGLSIINGAQTISAAAEVAAQSPECDISPAKVLVTIIKADSEGAFGRSVTKARNHQNPVSTANFASLDPRQETLRRELAYLGYTYHYRPEAQPRNPESSARVITIEQAMRALALFEVDPRCVFWLKNDVARFQNAEASEYRSLFTESLTGVQLVNKVKFFRFVRDVVAANAAATKGPEGLFYKHGIYVVAAVLAKQCRSRVDEPDVLRQEQLNQLLSNPLDQCRQTCWDKARPVVGQGRSVLASFQNQGNTVRLLESCMAAIYGLEGDATYLLVKNAASGRELFPMEIAQVAMDVIAEISREKQNGQPIVSSSAALAAPDIQQQITQRVQERLIPKQGDLLATEPPPVAEVVQKAVAVLVEHTIDIPRISVVPKGPVKSGYKSFKLDVSKMNFQPQDMALVGQGLKTGKQVLYGESSAVTESRLEDYIVRELINYDDVSYDDHAELIYELSGQAVAHFKGYLKADEELHNILSNYGKTIAENIHQQMAQHYYEDIGESEVIVSQGFTPLKPCAFTAEGDVLPLHQAPDDKGKIAQYVYGGFTKCAYPVQKFHSDTERVLAGVLERDASRWFRPVAGQFNIYYRSGANQPEYVPDFAAAMSDLNLIIEAKAAKDMENGDVRAKAVAAVAWCKNASAYSEAQGGKPWKYLLVPHDAVAANATLAALVGKYSVTSH